jgi:hypothetical protein
LVWFTFFLGFAWDVKAVPHVAGAGSSSGPAVTIYEGFIEKLYLPLAHIVKADGPTRGYNPSTGKDEPKSSAIVFRSVLDADVRSFLERPVPSTANYSRFPIPRRSVGMGGRRRRGGSNNEA